MPATHPAKRAPYGYDWIEMVGNIRFWQVSSRTRDVLWSTWSIMSALAPTITPPASVAFCMSTACNQVLINWMSMSLWISIFYSLTPAPGTSIRPQRPRTKWTYRRLIQVRRCTCWYTLLWKAWWLINVKDNLDGSVRLLAWYVHVAYINYFQDLRPVPSIGLSQ